MLVIVSVVPVNVGCEIVPAGVIVAASFSNIAHAPLNVGAFNVKSKSAVAATVPDWKPIATVVPVNVGAAANCIVELAPITEAVPEAPPPDTPVITFVVAVTNSNISDPEATVG